MEKYPHISKAAFSKIAFNAIKEDKVLDDAWTEKSILQYVQKHSKSSVGFVQFSTEDKQMIVDWFGPNAFSFMRKNLKDLRFVSQSWAAKFLLATDILGYKQVIDQPSVYSYVMQSKKRIKKMHPAKNLIFHEFKKSNPLTIEKKVRRKRLRYGWSVYLNSFWAYFDDPLVKFSDKHKPSTIIGMEKYHLYPNIDAFAEALKSTYKIPLKELESLEQQKFLASEHSKQNDWNDLKGEV